MNELGNVLLKPTPMSEGPKGFPGAPHLSFAYFRHWLLRSFPLPCRQHQTDNSTVLLSVIRLRAGSSSPAGLSTLVYAYVVDCAPTFPLHTAPRSSSSYSSSRLTQIGNFPMSAHLSRLCLFQRHLRSLAWVWVWVWDWIHWHTSPRTRSPSSRHRPFTHYPFLPR
jgi:hypothetical protein